MMTVNELKKNPDYEFECNISPEDYIGKDCYDDWGGAFIWLGEKIGVEYNICFDYGCNSSAIYPMYWNEETEYMETDTFDYVHYEIDFTDENWVTKFEEAMCKAMLELHKLN